MPSCLPSDHNPLIAQPTIFTQENTQTQSTKKKNYNSSSPLHMWYYSHDTILAYYAVYEQKDVQLVFYIHRVAISTLKHTYNKSDFEYVIRWNGSDNLIMFLLFVCSTWLFQSLFLLPSNLQ